jgi:peptidoglycan/xylan/chitin deacetylase (PgdA/CDA1 family)
VTSEPAFGTVLDPQRSAQTAVCLTFELDGTALWTGSFGASSASDRSRGDFEEIAVPRVLEILDRFDARATWFIPGTMAELYADLVRRIIERGHEVAHHGWAHEKISETDADNRQVLEQGIAVLERLSGSPPRGYRVPGGFMTDDQLSLVREYGFLWDSSLQGSDFTAYFVRMADSIAANGTVTRGSDTDLIEVPVSWQLDDFPAFEFVWGFNGGLRTPSQVLEIWKADFAFMRRSVSNGVFAPCFHTQVIGRGHRVLVLESLLEHVSSHNDVAFETISTYTDRWRGEHARGES